MKKVLIILFSSASLILYCQVGIGTTTPTRSLDIDGNLRVRVLTDKSTDNTYNKVIVSNVNGDLDSWDKASLKNTIKELAVENKKIVYFSSSPNVGSIMSCGKMQYRFGAGPLPQMRLVTPANATLYYNRMHKVNSAVNSFSTPNNVASNLTAAYTTANNWVTLDTTYTNNTLNEFYMTYPGDNNLYRVTFLARNLTATDFFYSMVCEKF